MGNGRRKAAGCTRAVALYGVLSFCFVFTLFWQGASAFGAEIRLMVPAVQVKTAQEMRIPVAVDQADRLAGIKLVIHYDKEMLAFKGGNRSRSADAMMHVINDKTPGKLIVVMAAARGISGKDVALLTLFFNVKKAPTEGNAPLIEIVDCQLMGDDLKDIPCKKNNRGLPPVN